MSIRLMRSDEMQHARQEAQANDDAARTARIVEVVAESLDRAYVNEAMRRARIISPTLDHELSWLTPDQARLVVLAGEIDRLTNAQ